jgi:dephospho-CoA kinase
LNVGFIGKLGSGKTFAANHLIGKYGFNRISLADPIKKIMAEYFNVIDKTDLRYRKLAQKLGTEWFRSEDHDVWVKYMIKTINHMNDLQRSQNNDQDINYVCDDIRFTNEAKKLLDNNWILFYLDCPEEIRIERCKKRDGVFDPATLNHSSETGVDDILKEFGDQIFKIDGSGSVEDTNRLLDIWMSSLGIHNINEKGVNMIGAQ